MATTWKVGWLVYFMTLMTMPPYSWAFDGSTSVLLERAEEHWSPSFGPQSLLDPFNRSRLHAVVRFGPVRQVVPDADLDPALRGSMVGSLDIAGAIRIHRYWSLLFTVPVGFENVDENAFVAMFGNVKAGLSGGRTLDVFDESLGLSLTPAGAFEVYLPTATGPSPLDCLRPFCSPMENMRRFRPDEPELWTNDTLWFRFRFQPEFRTPIARLAGSVAIAPGLVLCRDGLGLDAAVLFDWSVFGGLRLRRVRPIRNFELTLEVAGSDDLYRPTDRLYPNSPGLEDVVRAFGTERFTFNDLHIPFRIGIGLRYYVARGAFAPALAVTWDPERIIPLFVIDAGFSWPAASKERPR